jgi:hypothetical protein
MGDAELVPFSPDLHMDDFIKIYLEYAIWFSKGFIEYNQIDLYEAMGTTIEGYVRAR